MSQDPKLDEDLQTLLSGLLWGFAIGFGLVLLALVMFVLVLVLRDVGVI